MKAKPYRFEITAEGSAYIECTPAEATHVQLHMHGPIPYRMIPVILKGSRKDQPRPMWSWNGDTERPTLKPSILSKGQRELTAEEVARLHAGEELNLPPAVCHTWVTDGVAQYLADCTHEFAGQSLPLNDVED